MLEVHKKSVAVDSELLRYHGYEAIFNIFNEFAHPDRLYLLKRGDNAQLSTGEDFVTEFVEEVDAIRREIYTGRLPKLSADDPDSLGIITSSLVRALECSLNLSSEMRNTIEAAYLCRTSVSTPNRCEDVKPLASMWERILLKQGQSADRAQTLAWCMVGQRSACQFSLQSIEKVLFDYCQAIAATQSIYRGEDLTPPKRGRPAGSESDLFGELFANIFFVLSKSKPGYSTDGDSIKDQGFASFAKKLKNEIDPHLSLEVLVKGRSKKDRSEYLKEKMRRFG